MLYLLMIISTEETLCLHLALPRCGLKTIINLQRPGEHASCGYPLEPESGFTYRPEVFMEAGSESHMQLNQANRFRLVLLGRVYLTKGLIVSD